MNKIIKVLVGIIGFSLAGFIAIGAGRPEAEVDPIQGIILFVVAIAICAGTIAIIHNIE